MEAWSLENSEKPISISCSQVIYIREMIYIHYYANFVVFQMFIRICALIKLGRFAIKQIIYLLYLTDCLTAGYLNSVMMMEGFLV